MTPNSLNLSETEAHEALRVVDEERGVTSSKITELERFRRKVQGMDVSDRSRPTEPQFSGGDVETVSSGRSNVCCREVVDAFEQTLGTCEDTRLELTMCGELGGEVASTVLNDESSKLTPELKQAIMDSVDERRSQLRVLEEALEKEENSVRKAVELLGSIEESLVSEASLISLGFDELRQRHGSLIYLREDCEDRIQERQKTLSETTKEGATSGLRQMSLVEYLYEGLGVDHPVLSALTEAVQACEKNEMEVRKHICKVV